MRADFHKYILNFKRPSGTSRGVMTEKETWLLRIFDGDSWGIGECGILRGLSRDDKPDYTRRLRWLCQNISAPKEKLFDTLADYPSIRFGLEQALLSFKSPNPFDLFDTSFTSAENPIPINGLIWMGDLNFLKAQVSQKLEQGFRCLKFKIGALDFEAECELLSGLRQEFSIEQLEIRVDANGAFSPDNALEKLGRLAQFGLHSIEQPIAAGQAEVMAALCAASPLPIALDEELIPVTSLKEKQQLLEKIEPDYIILKPSLLGGYFECEQWIALAEEMEIGWWITSALESNIGLNAIAQWTASLKTDLPQGLGTGGLYTNNINAPLEVSGGMLKYNTDLKWDLEQINRICT